MHTEHTIHFGHSQQCVLKLEEGTVHPGDDPTLTVSSYPVRGLPQGELSILVTRTGIPAIVKVEAAERGTSLPGEEVEQIRKAAEGFFRSQVG
jgi:hypothetical protein